MGIIARQSLRGTIATYIGVAIGFVTTFFVLTRFLTAEEIGLARVLIDSATLLVGLAQLGSTSAIIRFFPYFKSKDDTSHHGFFFWTLIVPLVGFVLFALVFWLCRTPIEQWFGEKSPLFVDYYYFVLPLAFFMLYETVFESNANVLMRIVVPRAVREVGVRIGLLVSYLLYAFRVLSMDGFVVALCVTYATASLINIVYVCRIGKIRFRPDMPFLQANLPLVKSYVRYMVFLVLSALASVFAPMLSSFFVTAKMGLSFTGIFAIATYMAVMVSIPYRSLTAIASPQLASALKEQNNAEAQHLMQQVTNSMLLIGSLIFLLIWVNIDLIFHILPNGETYAVARQTVFLLGLTQLLLATVQVSVTALTYGRYYGYTLLFSLVLTLAAVLLNNYLIPLYGMEGSAWSNLLSYVLYSALVLGVVGGKMRLFPFCRTEGRTLGLMTFVLVINFLWTRFLPVDNVWLSSLLRSVVLIGGFCLIAYKGQFSEEINALLRSFFIRRH